MPGYGSYAYIREYLVCSFLYHILFFSVMTTSTPYFHEHVSRRRNKLRKLPQSRPAPLPRSGPRYNVDFNGKIRYGRPIGFLYLCQDDSGREYTTLRYDTAQGETLYRFEDHRKFRRALKQGRPLVDLNQRSSVVNGHSCDGRRHSCSDVHGSDSTGIVFDPVVAAARYSNQTRSSSSNAQSNTVLSSQQHRVSFTPSEERVRQAAGMSAEEFIEDRGALRYLQNTSPIPTQNDATRQDIPKKSRFSLPSNSSSHKKKQNLKYSLQARFPPNVLNGQRADVVVPQPHFMKLVTLPGKIDIHRRHCPDLLCSQCKWQ
ncbi:hypothetical protein DL96DRAFT_1737297 [Flagelloscypha sp. PMI_526]|nr:hypothetical protein DL96DRAFT_1737297 [Flagelloscypha sp. PMI_526]